MYSFNLRSYMINFEIHIELMLQHERTLSHFNVAVRTCTERQFYFQMKSVYYS